MKLFFNLFGLAAAGYLGYMAEPSLRFQLTGHQPSASENARDKTVILELPGQVPQIDLSSLTPEQLPQKVLLKTDVKVTDAASGTTLLMQAGNRVKLVRIEGGNAVVSPGEGPFSGLTPVTETDLFQQLAASPPTPKTTPEAPPAAETPVPVVPATGDSEEPAKAAEPPPVPEPAPEATPAPEPAASTAAKSMDIPDASPAPGAAAASAGSDELIAAMQTSIKAGQIKEFTFEQVQEWKAEANETVDGETYQTGLASYQAETIFGTKTIQAKALVKGGKVQRWIWPKSGMEIK
ncbi:MAG: hypothetical protein V4584_02635 [Verrucomicrobiota bacterium]